MDELRACPACGSKEARRSRRRGSWEQLLGRVGILPYVCESCRKRFLASKGGVASKFITALVCLSLATVGGWWFFKPGKAVDLPLDIRQPASRSDHIPQELKLREQIDALAGSLVKVRREKDALQAELVLLRQQLVASANNPAPSVSQPSGQSARVLLGRIAFVAGSSELDPPGNRTLAEIAARLAQSPQARVLVEGAADSAPLGTQTAARYGDNAGLALARALSVYRALREVGVEPGRMGLAASGRADSGQQAGRTVVVWLIPDS